MLFHFFLASIVSDEKSLIFLSLVPLYMFLFFYLLSRCLWLLAVNYNVSCGFNYIFSTWSSLNFSDSFINWRLSSSLGNLRPLFLQISMVFFSNLILPFLRLQFMLMLSEFILSHWSLRLCSVFFRCFIFCLFHRLNNFYWLFFQLTHFFFCCLHLHQVYSINFSFQLLFIGSTFDFFLCFHFIYLWNSLSVLSLNLYTYLILLIYFSLIL